MTDIRQVPPERVAGLPKLPPEARFSGALDGVPRVYRHEKCGVATEMPEEVIRSYLADPWLYNDWVWCSGCEDNIRQRDLVWTETGEHLSEYFATLRALKPQSGWGRSPIREPLIFGILGATAGYFAGSPWYGLAIGVAFGILLVFARWIGIR
jgi:hypothetical protein